MKRIRSRKQLDGDVVEIKINCGSAGKAVFRVMREVLIKLNRRLKTNGGSGITYDIYLKESVTSTYS